MPRTTLDIDATVLSELKRRQRSERKSLGQLASELLSDALANDRADRPSEPFTWPVAPSPMGARVDLEDKTALHRLLDSETVNSE